MADFVQVRVARPSEDLSEIERFYVEGLGLPKLGGFDGHAGYDGLFIGLPGHDHHLAFTRRDGGGSCSAPSQDNLLVLYYPDLAARNEVVARLAKQGHMPVEPLNPYWRDFGVTLEDPDGWRVVLVHGRGIEGAAPKR